MLSEFPDNQFNSMNRIGLHIDLIVVSFVVRVGDVVKVFRLSFAFRSLFGLRVLGWFGGFFGRAEAHAEHVVEHRWLFLSFDESFVAGDGLSLDDAASGSLNIGSFSAIVQVRKLEVVLLRRFVRLSHFVYN